MIDKITKKEIEKDIHKFKSLSALEDSEGGKLLVKTLKKDIKSDIEIIISLYNKDELELRSAVISLKKDLVLLQVLTKSKEYLDIALDALTAVEADDE